jgi:hypothetical protein
MEEIVFVHDDNFPGNLAKPDKGNYFAAWIYLQIFCKELRKRL